MKSIPNRYGTYYKITIESTGRNKLREKPHLFNTTVKTFETIRHIKEYFIDRYGKVPSGSNKIYHNYEEIGLMYSFWTSTIYEGWTSAKVKKWYQSDFIYIEEVHTKPISLRKVRK